MREYASLQSDQSSLSAGRNSGSFTVQTQHSEVSDQAAWMCRLICVFAWLMSEHTLSNIVAKGYIGGH